MKALRAQKSTPKIDFFLTTLLSASIRHVHDDFKLYQIRHRGHDAIGFEIGRESIHFLCCSNSSIEKTSMQPLFLHMHWCPKASFTDFQENRSTLHGANHRLNIVNFHTYLCLPVFHETASFLTSVFFRSFSSLYRFQLRFQCVVQATGRPPPKKMPFQPTIPTRPLASLRWKMKALRAQK